MSSRSLAAMVMQRRQEIEYQLCMFTEKCDRAVRAIEKMKQRAHRLSDEMNCDTSEIKSTYLSCMNKLVEYNYDMEMILDYLDDPETNTLDCTPVQDVPRQSMKPLTPINSMNLMDVLSESRPSTSKACFKQCPPDKPVKKKIRKDEQLLITFSSESCSLESVPSSKTGKELRSELADGVTNLTLNDSQLSLSSTEGIKLPRLKILELDCTYNATITYINGYSFWVVTDMKDAYYFMSELNEYYNTHTLEMCLNDLLSPTYCVCNYEGIYCRALSLRLAQEDMSIAEVFLVDKGQSVYVSTSDLLPLVPQFCNKPPFARCCHFAGVDLLGFSNNEVDRFLKKYENSACQIKVEDNSSESLGVYVMIPSGQVLNDMLVQYGLAKKIEDKTLAEEKNASVPAMGLPELSESNLDITDCPEYEDPLVAVTGYHNRDEKDICKNYKGGPEKTCFKGLRCTKRHEIINPDGWTSDRVAVLAKYASLPLPEPGTVRTVTVKHVEHYNSFFVHYTDQTSQKETLPEFGVVLPPMTLNKLVEDMNSPATRLAYKPCQQLIPAPGELVAALYPLDGNWYRAKVLHVEHSSQNVKVMYIDYGNHMFVKEDAVRELHPRFLELPAQAVRCVLAGVSARTSDQIQLLAAKEVLYKLIQELTLQARVISRGLDELTVELLDQGFSVAQEYALLMPDAIALHDCQPDDDTAAKPRIIAG